MIGPGRERHTQLSGLTLGPPAAIVARSDACLEESR
jgi:hypothetical protein